MNLSMNIVAAVPEEEQSNLRELIEVFNQHESKNRLKERYYEGHITLSEVNLGLAIPKAFRDLEVACAWGEKAVDVLASRSMFDGFVGKNGDDARLMTDIMTANRMVAEYSKACRDELKYGCSFATLSADKDTAGCRIRFHSPRTAAASWDGEKCRIKRGMAIVDSRKDETDLRWRPSVINYYTDYAIYVLRRIGTDDWSGEKYPHIMGRPLMEPMIWNATNAKPFGRSRLKEPIRRLIQGYVRTLANAAIGLEFATSPQKYLMGVTDDQFEKLVNEKFTAYVGSILAATTNPETGEKPTFGQLTQGNVTPHVETLRMLATQFSAATGLSATDVGIVNDANPSSSDAILAQAQTLVLMAEQLNTGNGDALYTIAQMAQAIAKNCSLNELEEAEKDIMPHFRNPAMPSVSVTADAAMKIASARQGFASTDVFAEMVGFDQATIRRIKAQEQRARGLSVLEEIGNMTESEATEAE